MSESVCAHPGGLRVRLIKKYTPSGISGMHHSPTHTDTQISPPVSVLNSYILYASQVTRAIYHINFEIKS